MFSDTAMRLQYYIIITGAAYFVFSIVVPNMSAMRMWIGLSTILTFGYIAVVLVTTINDGIRSCDLDFVFVLAITSTIVRPSYVIPAGKSKKHKDYAIKGSTEDKVFNALGALSAMMVSNNSGMIPEIQVK